MMSARSSDGSQPGSGAEMEDMEQRLGDRMETAIQRRGDGGDDAAGDAVVDTAAILGVAGCCGSRRGE